MRVISEFINGSRGHWLKSLRQTAGGTPWPERWDPLESSDKNHHVATLLEASCCPLPVPTTELSIISPNLAEPSSGVWEQALVCPLFSTVYLWEQPEEANSGPLLSLEEQILNSTFEACDPHKTGGGWESTGRAGLGPSSGVLQEQDISWVRG